MEAVSGGFGRPNAWRYGLRFVQALSLCPRCVAGSGESAEQRTVLRIEKETSWVVMGEAMILPQFSYNKGQSRVLDREPADSARCCKSMQLSMSTMHIQRYVTNKLDD